MQALRARMEKKHQKKMHNENWYQMIYMHSLLKHMIERIHVIISPSSRMFEMNFRKAGKIDQLYKEDQRVSRDCYPEGISEVSR